MPADPSGQIQRMRDEHGGKMRLWFNGGARWFVVLLDELSEFERLIFLESEWTKAEGLVVHDGSLNYRLLSRVADNAIASNYLSSDQPSRHCHRLYYEAMRDGELRLEGDSRVAVCSAEASELRLNPEGSFYLLDGVGRCLPYMVLIKTRTLPFAPVEAFLAERAS